MASSLKIHFVRSSRSNKPMMYAKSIMIIAGFCTLATLALFLLSGPIAQPLSYHGFADSRALLGIDNFSDVISNLFFVAVGAWGLVADRADRLVHDNYPGYPVYRIFFAGVLLTGFGSAWYHLDPNNVTLVWDRLPMTIGFMALTTGLLSEFRARAAKTAALPAAAGGACLRDLLAYRRAGGAGRPAPLLAGAVSA
ncbi:MAG: hypothetical protein WC247_15040, partial [Porticoccaceae bacterium]